jgi:hypothetical protein
MAMGDGPDCRGSILYSTASRPAVGPTPPLIQWGVKVVIHLHVERDVKNGAA